MGRVELVVALGLVLGCSCTRFGFEPARGNSADLSGRDTDGDVAGAEGGLPDSTADGPTLDRATPDAAEPDGYSPSALTCSQPQLVGTGAPSYLSEAALRTNGLELLARTQTGEGYSVKRSGSGQAFGAWSPTTLLVGGEDPTFFSAKGSEYAIVAVIEAGSTGRQLKLCVVASGTGCTAVKVGTPGGALLTDDMDGPTVALLSSVALMAFNLNTSAETDILLAETADPTSSGVWLSVPVATVNQAGVKEDDPALSPDGLVLAFNKPAPGMNGDIFVSERKSTAAPFPPARSLTEVNTTAVEGSAHLASLAPTPGGQLRYELFFSSTRGTGNYAVYRSVCTY